MTVVTEHVAAPAVELPAVLVVPRVNLLPPERAEQVRVRRIQLALGGGLLATVGVVGLLYAGASATAREAADELASATQAGAELQAETTGFADVAAVHAQAAQAKTMLSGALGQEVRYSQLLHELSRSVPDDVWLEDVTFTQSAPAVPAPGPGQPALGQVTFSGVAFEHDDVADWLEALARQDGFAKPTFSGATATELGERSVVTFTSTVELTADALSGRYTAPDGA